MEVFERLEDLRQRWNVLEHPFYARWSCGELTRDELAFYAGEYRHAVQALADTAAATEAASEPGLRARLGEHAAEEARHVDLWGEFAAAVGADSEREPRPETVQCVEAWTAAGDALEGLGLLYAIESGQPEISRTKLAGLVEHYGLQRESPATAYFTLHAERDHDHAAQARALLEELAAPTDTGRLLFIAEGALKGYWALLDGVERRNGRME